MPLMPQGPYNGHADYSTSVVIPTRHRPHLLGRAIASVLAQTLQPLEILVVVDGPDKHTTDALLKLSIPDLRVVCLPAPMGACNCRNHAVQLARGAWIAFLDDDDEWLPTKLERQVQAAIHSQWSDPIVCSRVVIRSPEGAVIAPRRCPAPGENAGDYLFCRRSILPGESFLQTSNLLTSRKLLETVPFSPAQKKWQDIDWLLRASRYADVGLEFVPEPLSVYYADYESRPTITGDRDWKYLFEWITQNRRLISRQAYSGALLVTIAHEAVREGDHHACYCLLREAVQHGEPNVTQLAAFFVLQLSHWTLPRHLRSQARYFLQRIGWVRSPERSRLIDRLVAASIKSS